jgi:hypothetical protein
MAPDEQPAESEPVEVPMAWAGLDGIDTRTANQFLITPDPHDDLMYLTVGLVSAPVFMGSEDEQLQQFRDLKYVTVRPLGRFALTRQRARQLADLLNESLARYDDSEPGAGT